MIRFVVIAAVVVLAWFVAMALWRQAKASNLDWTGITFAAGFIVLAFYLRHTIGLG